MLFELFIMLMFSFLRPKYFPCDFWNRSTGRPSDTWVL